MEFYRYHDHLYSDRVRVHEYILWVTKETPCGYWLSHYQFGEREKHVWVSKTSRKRYAYPTREEAMASFKARKRRQIMHLQNQLERAKNALAAAEKPEPHEIFTLENSLHFEELDA